MQAMQPEGAMQNTTLRLHNKNTKTRVPDMAAACMQGVKHNTVFQGKRTPNRLHHPCETQTV